MGVRNLRRVGVRKTLTHTHLHDYGIGAQILYDLGVRKMWLMTNNPKKVAALHGYGLSVSAVVPLVAGVNEENIAYLETKRDKMGHRPPPEIR